MKEIDWNEWALHSEIEFSKALGGKPVEYSSFIHIHNDTVPWGNDYNRTVGVRISGFESFDEVVEQVETIHKHKKLERPNRYDIYPPALDNEIWDDFLLKRGFRLRTAVFFCSRTIDEQLPSELRLYSPSEGEYIQWFHNQQKSRDYYNEEWFHKVKPCKLKFIKTFEPYWLLRHGDMVGWVYCARLGEYCSLFEVEIKNEFRNQGLGQMLLRAIRIEGKKRAARFVLLQSSERLKKYYEKAGFEECSRNSVIWLC